MLNLKEKIYEWILAHMGICLGIAGFLIVAIIVAIFSSIIDVKAINALLEKPLAETKFWHALLAIIFIRVAFKKD